MSIKKQSTRNVLVDKDIEELASQGQLITTNFDPELLSACAYDLRAGAELTSRNKSISHDISEASYQIQPGEIVTVTTLETLDFSSPLCFGYMINSHTTLSKGVFHPITSVDPGFTGPLTITLLNGGNSVYRIKLGDRIAKLHISSISRLPERIYGDGYEPRVKQGSIDHSLYGEKVAGDSLEGDQLSEFYGYPLGGVIQRVEVLEREAENYRRLNELQWYKSVFVWVSMLVSAAFAGVIASKWDGILEAVSKFISSLT